MITAAPKPPTPLAASHAQRVTRWQDVGQRGAFERSRGAELRYSRLLQALADQIGAIVSSFGDPLDDPQRAEEISQALRRYADRIAPWAERTAARVIAELDRQDATTWNRLSRTMSRELRREIATAPTGEAMRAELARQVGLIKSLPLEAAERVHKLTIEGMLQSTRASEIATEIQRTGAVTRSRAMLIARTEIGRTSTELTKARALHVGSEGYIWRTSKDAQVRPSHKRMEGRYVEWSNPPTLDGMVGHAGCLPNCRCYTEVVIPGLTRAA